VIGVPDSGIPAAIGYAEAAHIPYGEGLIRNRYIHRTFIQPDQRMREMGVRMKFTPLRETLNGKRIVVVEDSIVRGTTTRNLIHVLREAGAKAIHMRVSSPPYMWPCFYGIDTPDREKLVASRLTVDDICEYIGADTLGYLSLDNVFKAVGISKKHFCSACFDGNYPIKIPKDMKLTKLALEEANGA
jgi:amidophosphoribosyltransferase